jgi:hypothetical protein
MAWWCIAVSAAANNSFKIKDFEVNKQLNKAKT